MIRWAFLMSRAVAGLARSARVPTWRGNSDCGNRSRPRPGHARRRQADGFGSICRGVRYLSVLPIVALAVLALNLACGAPVHEVSPGSPAAQATDVRRTAV